MKRSFVDIHIIQTVPPSNVNRDDTGSPKTAMYGGVRRARISSQAWKRATRKDFESYLDASDLGVRTKRLVELVSENIGRQASEVNGDDRVALAKAALTAAGIKLSKPRKGEIEEAGYLVFLSHLQVEALASAAVEAHHAGSVGQLDTARCRALVKDRNSIDLSLFGRMVADVTDLNVDASAQVAHAISVHAVDNEYDYFTAVDDHKRADVEEDAGAGMIGTVEFNSSTLYRYATVDVDRLASNLGDVAAARRAVGAFVRSFVTSMPTGKQNTFANRTLPDAVYVTLRADQPVSLVGAFESAVPDSANGGRVSAAVQQLAEYASEVAGAYGGHPVAAWMAGPGDRVLPLESIASRNTFDTLISSLDAALAERLIS